MIDVLALILAGGRVDELLCLTENRAKSAVPIFGIYRIIDFILSNLMHSTIDNVGLLSQYRPQELVSHIGTGEHWDFIGRKRGIRILSPYHRLGKYDWYKGTADAVFQNIPYIEEFNAQHILIASADHIYRMNYEPLYKYHLQKNADVTICFKKLKTKSTRFGYGVIDNNGKLIDYQEKPKTPPSEWVSMTVYLFKKDFLLEILESNSHESSHEFGKDIIPKIVNTNRVFGFAFRDYWSYARTIDSYHKTNMDLLNGKIDLSKWQIRTNLLERSVCRDRLPAYINGEISNAIISEECVIEGKVKNSILSPGVTVASGAEVIDSIIFHDTSIEKNAKLQKVICDKDSEIGAGSVIGTFGTEVPSREFPDLLNTGITVLGKNACIPQNTIIGSNTVIFPSMQIKSIRIEPGSSVR